MKTDTLIIGCGIAGAVAALTLSENPKHRVTVISRAPNASESNTRYAQGGIVVRGMDDSPEALIDDILVAGAGLSSRKAATILAHEGAALVQSILVEACGVHFDKDANGELVYGLEAAHSHRRVVHVGDKTGAAITASLMSAMQSRPNIQILTKHTAIDLLKKDEKVIGALVLDGNGDIITIQAGQTILATGGLGQIYLHTSNPLGARGDGIAMAARIGVDISHLEYIQFHPTTLFSKGAMKPLITEAVRGEGAILLNSNGQRFMAKYAPDMMELAPRDVVARAIHMEMQAGGWDYMLLDLASQAAPEFIRERFPAMCENAAALGLDATRDALPIVPAAHYSCGGVTVDEWGRSSIEGLFAIGEVSCTGLHGANRLASTSLLEGLVWGYRAATYIQDAPNAIPTAAEFSRKTPSKSMNSAEMERYWQEIKHLNWEHLGIIRTESGLDFASARLQEISDALNRHFAVSAWDDALIGLRNAAQVAYLVADAASKNPQSIGAHYRLELEMSKS
jgi:L-aspartate oxidase